MREQERAYEQGGAEGEGERESPSRLHIQRGLGTGINPMTPKSQPELKLRVRHSTNLVTQAPQNVTLGMSFDLSGFHLPHLQM